MGLLVHLWHRLPKQIRFSVLRVVQRNKGLSRWLMFRRADIEDRADGNRSHLPPAELRYRVGANADAEKFVAIGKICSNDIQSALQKVDFELGSFNRILDFGCGCGRTLIHLRDLAPTAQIDGVDIDVKAIEWCRQNLKFAAFSLSRKTPPIDYAADTFDFIYAVSVFTHLDEDYQFRWLEELRRIAKPGAILLLTVNSLNGDKEFVFERSYEEGLFPSWYQNAYHSREYVFANFGKYFNVLDYAPRGMGSHQDVVVLQKPQD